MNKIEVMAPAGSFDSLAAAIRAGADSVYFGVGSLNMRSRATVNFSIDDLPKIIRLCRKAGVKTYLTLNIIVYDDELTFVRNTCDAAKAAGVDAVIAADMAVIKYADKIGLPVHVSVQANVSNIESVRFYAQFADVMVLARELTLAQINKIITTIDQENICGPSGDKVRVEIFAHGALCVSVSGKCYMSLGAYNSSANRGACFQNCRRRYRVIDEETGEELVIDNKYVMSPKDICTIEFLDRLLESGVSILKLEGRGRSADYVQTVTKVYREACNAWQRHDYTPDKIDFWLEELKTVFNRGFWRGGYYLGEPLGDWCGFGGSRAKLHKIHLGRVNKYFSKLGVAELSIEAADLKTGQLLLVNGPTTGALKFQASEIRLAGKKVETAPKGSIVSVPVPEKVRKNDQLYMLVERRFGEEAEGEEL
ncbi:U32 family peptidase [Lentisphaerota bacterium ZTH]|nr:U32 family peptidase [Lentisphaerota bacterium]WET07656.1 U32 family peptidase [Lentisphaerota bacterium ZTH]